MWVSYFISRRRVIRIEDVKMKDEGEEVEEEEEEQQQQQNEEQEEQEQDYREKQTR